MNYKLFLAAIIIFIFFNKKNEHFSYGPNPRCRPQDDCFPNSYSNISQYTNMNNDCNSQINRYKRKLRDTTTRSLRNPKCNSCV